MENVKLTADNVILTNRKTYERFAISKDEFFSVPGGNFMGYDEATCFAATIKSEKQNMKRFVEINYRNTGKVKIWPFETQEAAENWLKTITFPDGVTAKVISESKRVREYFASFRTTYYNED